MLDLIVGNLGTIIVCAVLLGVVAAVIISMAKKKKQGKSAVCDCGSCKCCPMHGSCHKNNTNT